MAAKIIDILLRLKSQTKGVDDADEAVDKHKRKVNVLGGAYKALRGVTVGVFKGIAHAARAALTAILGVSVAAAGSVREFVVWNKEAAKAWTMMDGGVGAFMDLRKEVAKLAPELGVAKSELGKGWYQALSAGVDKNNIVTFLRTAAKVSVADGSSIETAIDGITTVLNAFKIESSKADKVADLMFKTVRNGKTTFGDLASYISQVAPTASALGVGIDQVLAGVATLTKQGVPTATAMTQIRNSMLILNKELGDGWAKSITFQQALENVAKKGNYSAKALTKMFGRENVSGVLALVGRNAKMAASDLNFMRAEGNGLDEAFKKVDGQVGHWPRLWQTIRAYVSDVGQAIDTNLRPAINYVAKKLEGMRNSGGFNAKMAKIGAWVKDTTEKAIAGVNTVIDVISSSSVGGILAGTVGALVDLTITLLAEGLKSLYVVFIALAKIFAAAFSEEIMKIDLPFRDELKQARLAAGAKVNSLTPEQEEAFGVPEEARLSRLNGGKKLTPEEFDSGWKARREWMANMGLDQAAAIASSSKDADIGTAIAKAVESFKASRERIGTAGNRILDNLGTRTGTNVKEIYAKNLEDAKTTLNPPQVEPKEKKKPEPRKVETYEEQKARFAENQRRQRLVTIANRPNVFGRNATPEMVEESLGAQKELLATKYSPAAMDEAVKATEKLLEETDSGWAAMKAVLDAVAVAMRRQGEEIATVKEKINNLPGGR